MLIPRQVQPHQGLAPLVSQRTRMLIVGSFPGAASLKAQQYYGHPRNQFWPILYAIFGCSLYETLAYSYEKRSEWLISKDLGVWDVYAACLREGSLDSNIRKPVRNDFSRLHELCPRLEAIVCNGGESFRQAGFLSRALDRPVSLHGLPSTSPANAGWSLARKVDAWRAVFQQHGLI